ncbi:hypothetical protein F5146DRAFT_688146 [Armillaria mellea]|nr:hypothetical protein F5146DRAFT_688146 [Armillaria mellea]
MLTQRLNVMSYTGSRLSGSAGKGRRRKKTLMSFAIQSTQDMVLWATAGKRGWISLEVLKKKKQTDTENSILTEQIKADRKNQVSGAPFQAERVQRQPTPSGPQTSQSVGPGMVKSIPRETRRASTGTASYPSLAPSPLDKWVAGLGNNPPGANESNLMSPVSSNESPLPQGTSFSPMYHTFSPMPPISPMPVADSPMSFPPSILTAPPVNPPTPSAAPPHFDLTKINRSLSSPKSRTNASSSSMPRSFISPLGLTPRRLEMPLSGRCGSSQSSPTGPQRESSISHPPRSSATQKRKRVHSPVSRAESLLPTSSASSSLVRMEHMPAHNEVRFRPSKAIKTTHRLSSAVSPSKESAVRATTQCSVERENSQPKKLPAVVIDLTLSDGDDVSVPVLSPTALSPPQRVSPVAPSLSPRLSPTAPSPPPHISPIAPSPPPRVSLEAPSPPMRISSMAPSPPPAAPTLEDASLGELGDDSLVEALELQYPETEESDTSPWQYQGDFSDDVTIYGTLGFKAHHLHAIFQTNEKMVCRLCQQEDQAIFECDASFHELASHCEESHGEACHLIVALTPEQTKAWLELALVA